MAGFAVNLRLIQVKPYVWWGVTSGLQESEFLSDVGVAVEDLEPKANNCTKVEIKPCQMFFRFSSPPAPMK